MMRHDLTSTRVLVLVLSALLAGKPPMHATGPKPGVQWETDYRQAMQRAGRSGRLVLLDFYADWCGPCQRMAETTFRDPGVIQVLRQMICVRINIDQQRGLAEKFQISSIPRVLVMEARGKTVVDSLGYLDADTLLETFKAAGTTMSGIKFPGSSSGSATAKAPTVAGQGPRLVLDLGSPQRRVREQAAQQLRGMGLKAVNLLLKALSHEHLAVRIGAYSALADIAHPPANLRYDPWASSAARKKAARALKDWWARKSKR